MSVTSSRTATSSLFTYRFVYFNVRGAGELCRLVLAVSGAEWHDVRYPMQLAEQGFAYGPDYHRDAAAGAFACNLNHLPVLQVVNPTKDPNAAVATLGQSHAIARFVAQQHPTLLSGGSNGNGLMPAKVDSICESCRDIKSAWYQTKRTPGGKQMWFEPDKRSTSPTPNQGTLNPPKSLYDHCRLLEAALGAYRTTKATSDDSPWCLGTAEPTLADLSIYHMLSTPNPSPISGATASLFDGEREAIQSAYASFPYIRHAVEAVGALPAIQDWEKRRPDTFT